MVHVLLRGPRAAQGTTLDIAGVRVAVVGLVPSALFPESSVEPDDLYAVAWIEEPLILDALAALRRAPTVVDAMTDQGDKASTRRRRKLV